LSFPPYQYVMLVLKDMRNCNCKIPPN